MGAVYALACSVIWSFAVILFQRAGERLRPLAINLFRSTLSAVLLLATLAVLGQPLLRSAPGQDYLILIVSGVLGIAIADTLFHTSLNLVGSGITAIVSTAYSPLVVLFAFLLLDEHVRLLDLGGMALILSSIVLTGNLRPPRRRTQHQLVVGILLGVLDMAFLTFSVVLAKPVLDRSPVIWATAVRQIGSVVALAVMTLFARRRRRLLAVFRPSAAWRFLLPGAVLGSYVALILWIAAMKYSLASVAAILTQTPTVFILILAVVLLKERFTARKACAAALAVAGVLLIVAT